MSTNARDRQRRNRDDDNSEGGSGFPSLLLVGSAATALLAYLVLSSDLFARPVETPDSVDIGFVLVTDLDHDSKHETKKNTWESVAQQGVLRIRDKGRSATVDVGTRSADFKLSSQISAGGRAMELSDLCWFGSRLVTVDDRTGMLYEIRDKKALPWVFVTDGPGDETVSKGLKGEWLTVKQGELYVGGLGKEWTTTQGEYVNDHPMWVKIVSHTGAVRHVNWTSTFVKVRAAAGIQYPGYMIHEAVQWSGANQKWYFLPRRASRQTYSEEADEHRGTNLLIEADAHFNTFRVIHVGGQRQEGGEQFAQTPRGFSAFQFVPGFQDRLIVALKSEEKDGKPVGSFLTVFDIDGNVILEDTPLQGAYKFEGIAFLKP